MTTLNQELTADESQDDLELARKLAAAYIAHRAGHRSVDYTRKRYVDSGKIGPAWIDLARIVKRRAGAMFEGLGDVPMITTRTQ